MNATDEDIKLLTDKEMIAEINIMIKTLERLRKEIKSGGEFKKNVSMIYFSGLHISWIDTTKKFEELLKEKGVK